MTLSHRERESLEKQLEALNALLRAYDEQIALVYPVIPPALTVQKDELVRKVAEVEQRLEHEHENLSEPPRDSHARANTMGIRNVSMTPSESGQHADGHTLVVRSSVTVFVLVSVFVLFGTRLVIGNLGGAGVLVMVDISVGLATLLWGGLTVLTGFDVLSVSKWRLRRNLTRVSLSWWCVIVGMLYCADGICAFLATTGVLATQNQTATLIASTLLLVGLQVATRLVRFEDDRSVSLVKNASMTGGAFARTIGAVLTAMASALLLASLNWLGFTLSTGLIAAVITVSATLFVTMLINILTGGAMSSSGLPTWLPYAIAFLAFALLLTQNSWLRDAGPAQAVAPEAPQTVALTQPTAALPTPMFAAASATSAASAQVRTGHTQCLPGIESKPDELVKLLDRHLTSDEMIQLTLRFAGKKPEDVDPHGRASQLATIVTTLDGRVPSQLPELIQWIAANRQDLCGVYP